MSRKVYVELRARLIINADEDVQISDVLDEMGFEFSSNTDGADIVDMEIRDWEIGDSK